MGNNKEKGTFKKVNRGRKRKVNFEKWKDNERRHLRQSGKSYTNRKGIAYPEKNPPKEVLCCKCNFNCSTFSVDEMALIFNSFYGKNYNEQTSYLSTLMEIAEPKQRRVEESISRRQISVKYFLFKNCRRLRVCQKMWCHTFKITSRRIQVLINKIKNKEDLEDNRGKHTNRPHKIADDEKAVIVDHIKSFPTEPNHYSRTTNKNECLSANLNLQTMYNFYLDKYEGSQISYRTYRDVFTTNFKLRFGLPRSDTCKYCDKLFIAMRDSDEKDLSGIERELEIHHLKAEKAYASLKEDSNTASSNDQAVVLCVDLQQVLLTPMLTHSDIYYQRQYSSYNFAVHDQRKNCATMFFWHERIASRGSCEIASCIFSFITTNYQRLLPGQTRRLILWSDRCVGQNNNWNMIGLCAYFIRNNYFTEVNQKFLTSGHSFLPCDRDFALIERKKKSSTCYVPDQLVDVIRGANNLHPFTVVKMQRENFLNFNKIQKALNKDSNLKITEARWIQLTADEPNIIRVRKEHNVMTPWLSFNLFCLSKRKKCVPIPVFENLEPLYEAELPITAKKKVDLLAMCEYLPEEYKYFYESLISK